MIGKKRGRCVVVVVVGLLLVGCTTFSPMRTATPEFPIALLSELESEVVSSAACEDGRVVPKAVLEKDNKGYIAYFTGSRWTMSVYLSAKTGTLPTGIFYGTVSDGGKLVVRGYSTIEEFPKMFPSGPCGWLFGADM